jgi:hypothetical protein
VVWWRNQTAAPVQEGMRKERSVNKAKGKSEEKKRFGSQASFELIFPGPDGGKYGVVVMG